MIRPISKWVFSPTNISEFIPLITLGAASDVKSACNTIYQLLKFKIVG